jgi:hypothetical protein
MSSPYTSLQNGKVERIIRSVNNVIRTLLIQASLPERYWAEELHIATYILNRLPTMAIQAACPHLALFGFVPSYEHLLVFGCTCYPNTDLYFLCESRPTVSIIGTHLTTAGTSTPAPHRPTPEIPLGFQPPVAPPPASEVPLGFLPQTATMAAPLAIIDGPLPCTWPASPVTYVRRDVGASAAGTRGAPGAAMCREVGVEAAGTHGALGAALRGEVGAGAMGTRGTPGAALRWEAGAEAMGTHGALGAALSREVGVRAMRTRGTPRAALCREVGA